VCVVYERKGEEVGDKCVYALHICSVYLCVNSSIKVYRMSAMSVCQLKNFFRSGYTLLHFESHSTSIFNLNLVGLLFNETRKKIPRERDQRLRVENEEMTVEMQ